MNVSTVGVCAAALVAVGLVVPVRAVAVRQERSPATLTIRSVHLEDAEPVAGSPSVMVSFELYNGGEADVEDIELAVSLVQTGRPDEDDADAPATVVGPLRIRVTPKLQAGHSLVYEIRLKNISTTDCRCTPHVTVLGARVVLSAGVASPEIRARVEAPSRYHALLART